MKKKSKDTKFATKSNLRIKIAIKLFLFPTLIVHLLLAINFVMILEFDGLYSY